VNGGSAGYAVRFRATADDVYNTTQPKVSQMWCLPLDTGVGIRCPVAGTVTFVDLSALTPSGTADDTEILLVNLTQGTYEHITWTGANYMDQVASTLVVAVSDELALAVIQEDGTTEFANGQMVLTIEP
jgi:hypothetical protein